jgi:hypothetical protein
MVLTFGYLLNPFFDLLAIVIILAATERLFHQELTRYRDSKLILLFVNVLFVVVASLELLRNLYPTFVVMSAYSYAAPILIICDSILLGSLAYVIYVQPRETTFRERLGAFLGKRLWPHGVLLLSFTAYNATVIAFLLLTRPFQIVQRENLAGFPVSSTLYDSSFLAMLAVTAITFVAYPCVQLFRASAKSMVESARRSLRIITFGWMTIGFSLILINGYMVKLNVDASALGYLIVAICYSFPVVLFGRTTLLEEFFRPVRPEGAIPLATPFSTRLGLEGQVVQGEVALLEVSPSTEYENVVREFATEQISRGGALYIFTSRGSPVWNAISKVEGARVFVFTDSVSYPRQGDRPFQMLLPRVNEAVLLDTVDKMLTSNPPSDVAFAFDSVSDFVLYLGAEKSYLFIKRVLELVSQTHVTGLFLLTVGAQEEQVRNLMISLFGVHLTFDSSGLRVTRRRVEGR